MKDRHPKTAKVYDGCCYFYRILKGIIFDIKINSSLFAKKKNLYSLIITYLYLLIAVDDENR